MLLFRTIGYAIERRIRAATLSFFAGILFLVGLGFLTSALWMVLSTWQDPLFAAQVLGSGFVGLSAIVFLIAKIVSRPRRVVPPPAAHASQTDPLIQMLEGFLLGMDAGRRTRRTRRRED
ncbi:phage holin family protein [Thalassococcus sp. BH17M4-6]|uniref:phage holin family protein n=1 Tax=Thalassococcus sp. BH17M4-6 TaxID=3413148 RepID=UPI003BC4168A